MQTEVLRVKFVFVLIKLIHVPMRFVFVATYYYAII